MDAENRSAALDAMNDCEAALAKLDKLCCEPGRSPSMRALSETLALARAEMERFFGAEPEPVGEAFAHLEDAGAQIGRLEVGCCAPSRLPLYSSFLANLTTAQLSLNRELGLGH